MTAREPTVPSEPPDFPTSGGTSPVASPRSDPIMAGTLLGDASATLSGAPSAVVATSEDGLLKPDVRKPEYVPIRVRLSRNE